MVPTFLLTAVEKPNSHYKERGDEVYLCNTPSHWVDNSVALHSIHGFTQVAAISPQGILGQGYAQDVACCVQAGSERVKDTKTSNGMLKEAGSINKSLFTLGKVWTSHIPASLFHFYRIPAHSGAYAR